MPRKHIYIILIISLLTCSNSFSQESIVYKQIDSINLSMKVYFPKNMDTIKKYPAIVFFFGGGWTGGTIKQFEPHANYFS